MKPAFVAPFIALPVLLLAFSGGPPIMRTGVPVDADGVTCTACHRTFELNSPGGRVQIQAGAYQPGQKQIIRVTVEHAEATKWGFQLTARRAGDLTKKAGTFTPTAAVRVVCADNPPPAQGQNLGRVVTAENPCPAEALEFASHNATSAVEGGSNGSKTFEVEWTPPSEDIGEIAFYAAGNAANASASNVGDRIYNSNITISSGGCPNATRPTLQSIVNAASRGREVSMNSMIEIYGRDFAASGTRRTAGSSDIRDRRYPRELGCVAVEVAGQRVPVTYVGFDQINAQIPTVTQTGSVSVRVILNPGRPNQFVSDVATINLQNYAPALFTFNGRSVAAVHSSDGVLAADPSVVSGGRAVRPGDRIQLYATGLGDTVPDTWQAGELSDPTRLFRTRVPVTVTIGGTTLAASDVTFAGLAPGQISGLYQLDVRTPATLSAGEVPVTISIGGVTSPSGATIPVRTP